MNKPVCKDILILSRKSTPANRENLQAVRDLLDTPHANIDHCEGILI